MDAVHAILNTEPDYVLNWLRYYLLSHFVIDTPAGPLKAVPWEHRTSLGVQTLQVDVWLSTRQGGKLGAVTFQEVLTFTVLPLSGGRLELQIQLTHVLNPVHTYEVQSSGASEIINNDLVLDTYVLLNLDWPRRVEAFREALDHVLVAISERWPEAKWKQWGISDEPQPGPTWEQHYEPYEPLANLYLPNGISAPLSVDAEHDPKPDLDEPPENGSKSDPWTEHMLALSKELKEQYPFDTYPAHAHRLTRRLKQDDPNCREVTAEGIGKHWQRKGWKWKPGKRRPRLR